MLHRKMNPNPGLLSRQPRIFCVEKGERNGECGMGSVITQSFKFQFIELFPLCCHCEPVTDVTGVAISKTQISE